MFGCRLLLILTSTLIFNGIFYETEVESARILTVFPQMSRSHYIPLEELLKELARRGHEVTAVSFFPQKKPLKNFRDIGLKVKEELDEFVKDLVDHAGDKFYVFKMMLKTSDLQMDLIEASYRHPDFQKIMSEEQFDLVIFEGMIGDANIGLGAHFNCPIIAFIPFPPMGIVNKFIGNLDYLSFVANPMLSTLKGPMNFQQRLMNIFMSFITDFVWDHFRKLHIKAYETQFPQPKYPPFDEMVKNVSLVMTNYHFSQGMVRPNVPALIELGGLQVKTTPDPLPNDLKKWMDEATHGVVYMSMGSNVKSALFAPEKLNVFLQTFAKLKQRVVWKFENSSLPGLPSNVFISKWLPQDDLLAHPNIKLFITHGGLGSVLEAKVRAVPVVGIPIFADQISNVEGVVSEGWGLTVAYVDLSVEKLSDAIEEILSNSIYKSTVDRLSKIFLDRPQTAMETGVYWIEYVLRHRGAKHIQSNSVHLNFFQLHSLDVIGFLLIIILIIFYIEWRIVKYIWKRVFTTKSVKNKKD